MEGRRAPIVHLNRFHEWPASAACRGAAEEAVRLTLRRADRRGADRRGGDGAPGGEHPAADSPGGPADEVSVTCLPAEEIREMNRSHLSRDRPTDVIAFELGRRPALLGDVYVCPEVARDEAGERGISPSEEVLRLVIHGVLHVLGWEHPEGASREESEMFRVQEELLRQVLSGQEGPGAGPEAGS